MDPPFLFGLLSVLRSSGELLGFINKMGSSGKVGRCSSFVILNLFQDLLLKHVLYSPRVAES